ncbi:MAG: 50S ribosomal protein L17 [Elusimicrobia bacterium]|nr:50S ribosomal protein L17 [Elusimicrobiota bacterium]
MIKTYGSRKLSRRSAARKILLRQLATHLIHHERITTTSARAKELKTYVERLISSIGSIADPVRKARETSRWLAPNGFKVEKKLVDVVLPRYKGRQGGHLRILKLVPRPSDQTRLARVELVV